MRSLAIDPLRDAQELLVRIRSLQVLLEHHRRQIEAWNDKLYDRAPAETAARRLLALKHGDSR